MSNTQNFKILTDREHARKRPNMYLGSISEENVERFVNGEWKEVTYVPALVKMVDEITDNCIDEAIRTKFKHANEISVTIDDKSAKISDNGRGIPQDEIIDEHSNAILRPIAAWTKMKAGSNFEDSRTVIGANGVGSACTNFMSSKFTGRTWTGGNELTVKCKDGADNITISNKAKAGCGTSVEFFPDMSLFKTKHAFGEDTIELVQDRLASLQVAFPDIRFKFNGRVLSTARSFKKYAKQFADNPVIFESKSLSFFIGSSFDEGYRSTSYINGVNTRLGGSYNDYVVNSVITELSAMIKRKYKIEVGKPSIKNGLIFVLFAKDFADPMYDSQTKERLTSSIGDVKAHVDNCIDFSAIAKKMMNTPEIIEPIVEAQLAKKLAADKRAATLAQKKLRKIKVAKHIAATGVDSTLFICEGDSALGYLLKVRDPSKVGGYPLRGVIMNTWDMKPSDILKNKELCELVAVLGLDLTDPDSVDNMTYRYIATLTDQDHDGIGHIMPLLIAFFYKHWPRLFTEGRVKINRTPIQISEKKGVKPKWFYNVDDAQAFKVSDAGKSYHHRYIKGLASHQECEYDQIINKPMLDTVTIDDPAWFEIAYGKNSELRKDWLTA